MMPTTEPTESSERLVLVQYRQDSTYNDFLGKYYHFPRKYLGILQEVPKRFVYYDPGKGRTEGCYFGEGIVTQVFEDKREQGQFFAEVSAFHHFSADVPFRGESDLPMERGPGYNPQNSVRRLSGDEFDAICLRGGLQIPFTADTHLIRVLGEELIATEVVGVLELVKNAFDAKAVNCRVRIEQVPGLPATLLPECEFPDLEGPVVVVEDDGCGMDLETVRNAWMRPASVAKTAIKAHLRKERETALEGDSLGTFETLVSELKSKHGGRIPLGEKGVGRFAAHRLGRHLILRTKTAGSAFELELRINWEDFDRSILAGPADLSSVKVSVRSQEPRRRYGPSGSGTQLVIYGGRSGFEISEEVIREINRSLIKLQSPQRAPDSFSVVFECPQISDLDETPLADQFPPAFSVDALFDERGVVDIEWHFNPPRSVPLAPECGSERVDLRRSDLDYWSRGEVIRAARCGPFMLHLDLWYRRKPWIDGPHVRDFQQHLENFGGVAIYRDGMNVLPADWGTKVDWLRLSKRHIKKTVNLSYYNFLGNLEIDQTSNIELTDKTDREGLLENQAFLDLAALTRGLVLYLENPFKGKRDQLKKLTSGLKLDPRSVGDDAETAAEVIGRLVDRYDVVQDSASLLDHFPAPPEARHDALVNLRDSLRNLRQSLQAMEEVQDQLTEHAGYGLALGVAVHEIAKITANFYTGLAKALRSEIPDRELLEPLQDSAHSLKQELRRLGPFRAVRNERKRTFGVKRSVDFVRSVFQRLFEKHHIDCVVSGGDFQIHARYGALNQILTNLIDNALYWVRASGTAERKIEISVRASDRCIVIGDSGEGLAAGIRPYLFEPGYSLKQPPSGLGLYICKYYMRSMGGDIYECPAVMEAKSLEGAQFCLDFSRVPEEEE